MSVKKSDILSMTISELESLLASFEEPKYRATQIFEWLHKSRVDSFQKMDNLPKKLRAILEENCRIASCKVAETRTSSRDETQKFLFELEDSTLIESVRMQYNFGHSICISTQAGCRMGCKFCASSTGGLLRNLTAGEMCSQVYSADKNGQADDTTQSVTNLVPNIVLMGCGEPLDNFDQVIRFIELIGHPKGANVGARHITLSTCGLVPQIMELADQRLQITLAISLHGPDDQIRKALMPIAGRYPIGELIEACRYYFNMTKRRLTFEYALVRGFNDNQEHAIKLAKLLSGLLCHVNLIPVNPAIGNYSPTLRKEAEAFSAVLQRNKIKSTIRRTIGSDVDAACGQLRANANAK